MTATRRKPAKTEYDLSVGLKAVEDAMSRHFTINTVSALARHLGVSKQAVRKWWHGVQPRVATPHVLAVSKALNIPRSLLRPDLYPPHHESVKKRKEIEKVRARMARYSGFSAA